MTFKIKSKAKYEGWGRAVPFTESEYNQSYINKGFNKEGLQMDYNTYLKEFKKIPKQKRGTYVT